MIAKMPPTPVAAAMRLARNGTATCPIRLPVIRSDMTVPIAAAEARSTTLVRLSVVAMPSENPMNGHRRIHRAERNRKAKQAKPIAGAEHADEGQRLPAHHAQHAHIESCAKSAMRWSGR